jgi:ABC-type Fe3+-hydroxamate transport system substrate-binding protein
VSPERGAPSATPQRIVSLVPSLTETCFDVGLGDRVVGVTDWCVHPADEVARLPKVGGTKDADVDAIAALAPDLVIANHEENTRRVVEALEARGLRVWLTYPRTLADGARVLHELAALSPDRERARRVAFATERALGLLEEPSTPAGSARSTGSTGHPSGAGHEPARRPRVFCPIWRDPWMAVGGDTYASDLIERCGGTNVFASTGDRRYPIVSLDDVVAAAPDVVLLPDEPYAFGEIDAAEIRALDVPAAAEGRVHLIDGTWVSWYGSRIAKAVGGLRPLLEPPAQPPATRPSGSA